MALAGRITGIRCRGMRHCSVVWGYGCAAVHTVTAPATQYQWARPPTRRPVPPKMARMAPTTTSTIPMVHRIEMLAMKPMINKMTPRTITIATSGGKATQRVRSIAVDDYSLWLPLDIPTFDATQTERSAPRESCTGRLGPSRARSRRTAHRPRWTPPHPRPALVVRMHKVRQWYPSEQRHKVIHRGPYINGPHDKPLGGETVRGLVR